VESATWLATLYRWWQKPWHEHGGHLSLGAQPDARLFLKSPLTQRLANEIPGIGYEKSEGVAQKFKTVKAMVDAEQREWLTIPGIGKILAERAYRSLREP
jgi:DNA integrity scanning protein DisA with diadenylate cyclase activity